jgi:hypothetical protein
MPLQSFTSDTEMTPDGEFHNISSNFLGIFYNRDIGYTILRSILIRAYTRICGFLPENHSHPRSTFFS